MLTRMALHKFALQLRLGDRHCDDEFPSMTSVDLTGQKADPACVLGAKDWFVTPCQCTST